MTSKTWPIEINGKRYLDIDFIDSEGNRIWIKFVPIDNTVPMEVAHILDQSSKVSWATKNSPIDVINPQVRKDFSYEVDEAGSIEVSTGTTVLSKDNFSKVLIFPLSDETTMNVQWNTINGDKFTLDVNKDTWVGYVSTRGTISPT